MTHVYLPFLLSLYFYSHASCEAWHEHDSICEQFRNFYSHASCEAWQLWHTLPITRSRFLLTCLLRGMTAAGGSQETNDDISTHMPLARHDVTNMADFRHLEISTHMPLARHDRTIIDLLTYPYISTHMPLARHDKTLWDGFWYACISTHMPLARHDLLPYSFPFCMKNFYSHASCEAWLMVSVITQVFKDFYSHASCEAWLAFSCFHSAFRRFLLTCLLRGMTTQQLRLIQLHLISTHMPLARHDILYIETKKHFEFLLTCLLRGMTPHHLNP